MKSFYATPTLMRYTRKGKALKRWGSPIRQGSGSLFAHLWATSDFAPRSEAVGIPNTARVR